MGNIHNVGGSWHNAAVCVFTYMLECDIYDAIVRGIIYIVVVVIQFGFCVNISMIGLLQTNRMYMRVHLALTYHILWIHTEDTHTHTHTHTQTNRAVSNSNTTNGRVTSYVYS